MSETAAERDARWARQHQEWCVFYDMRERAHEEYRRPRREKASARREAKRQWAATAAKILAEARRREAERAVPEPPFYSSDNPLDGTRLWDNS